MSLISILLGILAIGILALVHELGHFVMAKASKVGVEELSIGMGPKLFSVKGKKTAYSLRLLPFFAYVKMKRKIYVEILWQFRYDERKVKKVL